MFQKKPLLENTELQEFFLLLFLFLYMLYDSLSVLDFISYGYVLEDINGSVLA